MSRIDKIHHELQVYLQELDDERARVAAFLASSGRVLDNDESASGSQAPVAVPPARRETPGGGSGDDLAFRLMAEKPAADWSAATLLPVLREAGWTTTALSEINAVAAILSRLTRAGRIERSGRGAYRVPVDPTNADSPAVDAGLSDELDLVPEGGENTDGQGSHHDHRDDLTGRNGDRDHLGAPVRH